ncbi:hypothetical protein [uncultured Sphingomonas sp.]|uniref:hypothetical protein n=1 Tax=uncultured Sphingomonas sp. TaxID=158754 RepID=UPI0025FD599B|nr:hypothetical protein [uncultured Sphingomonas sp.]
MANMRDSVTGRAASLHSDAARGRRVPKRSAARGIVIAMPIALGLWGMLALLL